MKRNKNIIKSLIEGVSSFKGIFSDVIKLGLPHPLDGKGEMYNKEYTKEKLMQKKNELVQFYVYYNK